MTVLEIPQTAPVLPKIPCGFHGKGKGEVYDDGRTHGEERSINKKQPYAAYRNTDLFPKHTAYAECPNLEKSS